jgi:DNA-3-methyladenine glycosylase
MRSGAAAGAGGATAGGSAVRRRRVLGTSFYARPVLEVARDLIGCVVWHGEAAGVIVEAEAYHDSEPAAHSFVGLTPRTRILFGPPGFAYVYRSYGIHALLNAVSEPEGVGAAVLIRALEPVAGIDEMRERRGVERIRSLCSGPGKLTQALAIGLEHNGSDLRRGPRVAGCGGHRRPPDRDHQGRRVAVAVHRHREPVRVEGRGARRRPGGLIAGCPRAAGIDSALGVRG